MALKNTLAELKVIIDADTKNLKSGLVTAENQAKRSSEGISASLSKISTVAGAVAVSIIGVMGMAFKKFVQYGDEVSDAADKTGLTIIQVQRLGGTFRAMGMSIDDMTTAVKFMQKNLSDALDEAAKSVADSTGRIIKSEQDLKDSLAEITQNSNDDITELTADLQLRIKRIKEDAADRAAQQWQNATKREYKDLADRKKNIEDATTDINDIWTDTNKDIARSTEDTQLRIQKIQKDTAKRITEAQKSEVKAVDGTINAFKKLGININEFKNLNTEEQFYAIADGLAKIQSPAERSQVAMDIFGRSGQNLFPLLSEGSKGIKNMQDRLSALGLIMDEAGIKKADKLDISLNILGMQLKNLWVVLGEKVGFGVFLENISNILKITTDWIKANPELIQTIFKIAAAVMVLVGVLKIFAIAQAIATSMSGWAGLAALAAGALAAWGAVAGIEELFKKQTANVPKFAAGGVVSSPTLAMVGERGPEAIVPLSNMGGSVIKLYLDGEQISEVVERRLGNKARLSEARNYA